MYNRTQVERRKRRLYEVVDCLNNKMDTKQIADELGVSRRTAQRYVQYILLF